MRLHRYILRRLILIIPVLIGVSIIIFTLTRVTGDPGAAYKTEKNMNQWAAIDEKYHFNDPIWVQYFYWLQGILQGDWGLSKSSLNQPVLDVIILKFPATAELALVSMFLSVFIGIWLGTRSAVRRNKPFDHSTRVVSLIGVSIPVFWLAMIMQLIFFRNLNLMPSGGRISDSYIFAQSMPDITGFYTVDSLLAGNINLFLDVVWHLILPAVTLSFATIAIIMRIQRNSMLEVIGLDYVRTARAKGVPENVVIKKHARRNALIPTTTVVGLSFAALLAGAVLTETIFYWPGLGRWSTQAILRADSTSIIGFTLIVALVFVIANLIVDITYAYLDPRVRLG